MGIFSRKPQEKRETFGQAMARARAKNAERRERMDERRTEADAKMERTRRQNELLKIATARATEEADRAAAIAELVELIGKPKADKLIGARSRLVQRGWVH
jgi:hypothetical protein